MSKSDGLDLCVTPRVRAACLCLHVQRAARALARRFDAAFRPAGLTNGQFSLMMALHRIGAPRIGQVSEVLAMDRTTLTAALKPLERRGLVRVETDESDRRSRRLSLTDAGRELLAQAYPIWEREHEKVEALITGSDPDTLRADLRALS